VFDAPFGDDAVKIPLPFIAPKRCSAMDGAFDTSPGFLANGLYWPRLNPCVLNLRSGGPFCLRCSEKIKGNLGKPLFCHALPGLWFCRYD